MKMIQTVGNVNALFITAKGQKENKWTQLAAQQMEKDNEKKSCRHKSRH